MIIRFVGNSNIRKGVSYPVSIDLNGKPSTVYITGEDIPILVLVDNTPLCLRPASIYPTAPDKEQGREYYGEMSETGINLNTICWK